MIMHPDILLSDKFAEFSGKINALHEKKKELVAEFKKVYEEHKAALKSIDEEAASLHSGFEAWQNEQSQIGRR